MSCHIKSTKSYSTSSYRQFRSLENRVRQIVVSMASRDIESNQQKENVPPTFELGVKLEPPILALYFPVQPRRNKQGKRKAFTDITNFQTVLSSTPESELSQLQVISMEELEEDVEISGASSRKSSRPQRVPHKYGLRSSKKPRPDAF